MNLLNILGPLGVIVILLLLKEIGRGNLTRVVGLMLLILSFEMEWGITALFILLGCDYNLHFYVWYRKRRDITYKESLDYYEAPAVVIHRSGVNLAVQLTVIALQAAVLIYNFVNLWF